MICVSRRSCTALFLLGLLCALAIPPASAQTLKPASAQPSVKPGKTERRLRVTLKETAGASTSGGQVYSTANVDSGREVQQVMVIDGGKAFMRTGQSVPISSLTLAATPADTIASQDIRFRDLNSGFYVAPKLTGDTVTAEVSVSRDVSANVGSGPGSATLFAIVTTVSGKIGQWIEIGSTGSQAQTASTISTRSVRTSGGERHILIKFEDLH